MVAMYSTVCTCPVKIRLFLLNFMLRMGHIFFDHLAADGACLTGGQVAVVAVGQVDAHFLSDKHLETVHGLTSLRNVQLIVVGIAHRKSLLLSFSGKAKPLSSGKRLFSFRTPIFSRREFCMLGFLRKRR